MTKPTLDVAIAILLHHGKVLVGWRQAGQHQGNKHEFPGGKVELGESPEQACRREIYEEVGIGLKDWHVFDVISHEYDDLMVNLHVFSAYVPSELLELIQPPWAWYSRDQLAQLNFPKANAVILARLIWSHLIKISEQLNDLPQLDDLLYWRMDAPQISVIEQQLQGLNTEQVQQVILNIHVWQQLSPTLQSKIHTLHLKQSQLMQLKKGDLPVSKRVIAACHDAVSLQQAHVIGCDAVLLSPVQPTTTHPSARILGWQGFADLASHSQLPVFALGGVAPADVEQAQKHHAYGLAGIAQFKHI